MALMLQNKSKKQKKKWNKGSLIAEWRMIQFCMMLLSDLRAYAAH